MHTDISYKGDNSPRRAIVDLIQWFGFRRARQLCRLAAGKPAFGNPGIEDLSERWNTFNWACGFGGVSGHPVRETFKHFARLTQEELEAIPD